MSLILCMYFIVTSVEFSELIEMSDLSQKRFLELIENMEENVPKEESSKKKVELEEMKDLFKESIHASIEAKFDMLNKKNISLHSFSVKEHYSEIISPPPEVG